MIAANAGILPCSETMSATPIVLSDTTLRGGQPASGTFFTADEKVTIAQALARAGVTEIEAGTPTLGNEEINSIRAIVEADLPIMTVGCCGMREADVDAATEAKVSMISVSIVASDARIADKLGRDRELALARVRRVVSYARERGLHVTVVGEDSSRADIDFLITLIATAKNAGARRFCVADTFSVLDPGSTYALIARLRPTTDLELEFRGHNDLGLATANTLAAVKGGASHASVTVCGLGERAGIARLDEVAVAMKQLHLHDTGIVFSELDKVATIVASAAARVMQKSVIAERVFTHTIHIDGLKDHRTYRSLQRRRCDRILHGEHSILSAIASLASRMQLKRFLSRIRKYTVEHRNPVARDIVVATWRKIGKRSFWHFAQCTNVEHHLGQVRRVCRAPRAPTVLALIREDIAGARLRDPAARSALDIVLTCAGVQAVIWYRIANRLWTGNWRLSARLLSSFSRFLTNVEIHPAATIGSRFLIAHGACVVIGETAEIGSDVTLHHGVTLGSVSWPWSSGKRHPTLEDGVVVGAGAKVLGAITVGRGARIGANSVVNESTPPDVTLVGIPARVVRPRRDHRRSIGHLDLNHHLIQKPVGEALAMLLDRLEFLEVRLSYMQGQMRDSLITRAPDIVIGQSQSDAKGDVA